MEIETLSCPVCYSEFDQTHHIPRIIPSCGHTVCSTCLQVLLKTADASKCPLDKIKFPSEQSKLDSFPPNFILNQVISSQVIHGLCHEHNEPMRLVCLVDKCLVCDDCVYEGVHKGHEIRPIKKFKVEIDKKRRNLEGSLEQMDAHSKQLINMLEQGRLAMVQIVEHRFKKLKLALSQKELEFSYEINSFFNLEKDRVNRLFGTGSNLRVNIAEKISKQKNFLREKNLFDMIEEDISNITGSLSQFLSKDCLSTLEKGLENISSLLDETMAAQPDPLPQWQFPIKEHLSGLSSHYLNTKDTMEIDSEIKESLLKVESFLNFQVEEDVLVISVLDTRNDNVALNVEEWRHIKQVNLDLERYDLLENDLETLYYVWNKLDSMKSLKVRFGGLNVTDDDLFRVFPVFWKSKPLEALEVNLEKCGVTDKSLTFFAEQILTKIPGLKDVKLRLWKTNITDNTLKAIAKASLPALKQLKNFKLCLRNTNVTDEGISEVLGKLPSGLESIDLNLMETSVADKSIKEFAVNSLRYMKRLDSLEMLLWKTGVSDEGVTELFRNMQDVSVLRLNLDSTSVSDKSIEVFADVAGKVMKGLRELKMDLHNTQVSESSVGKVREIRNKIA